ncbi:MAG: transcription antitermination factor NusB [Proteobacteria bacterium]|nr:transcription antitermination factor NusB [Pseudomonadota bacterium]
MASNRGKQDKYVPEALTEAEVLTRDVAAECFMALKRDPHDSEVFSEVPGADMALAKAIVKRESPYEDVTDELVDEILSVTHGENYEIHPWREAVLSVLTIEFLSNLKASSAQLVEDAVCRVSRKLGDSYRGTTKNACQQISGQRTRMRKTMRMLVLASLYLMQFRKMSTLEQNQDDVMSLVQASANGTWYRFRVLRDITVRQLREEMKSLMNETPDESSSADTVLNDSSLRSEQIQSDLKSLLKTIPNGSSLGFEQIQNDVMALISSDDFIRDEFPFDGYLSENGLNARGRFAFCEAMKFVRKMAPHMTELDALIQKSSKRWRIERMALVDLNILRMATYELLIEKKSSPGILINEAVELAKAFGAEQSSAFVNGILQQICNDNADA